MKTKSLILSLFLGFNLYSFTADSQNIMLWNGESPEIADCIFSNGVPDNTSPHTGQWAFKANINKWKSGVINLKCQNTWRIDLSSYTEIQFYIKLNTPGSLIKFGFTAWPYNSNMVDITPYVVGGPLNSDYKLVKIPINVLKNADCQLHSVEQLKFETEGTTYIEFLADDFLAVDTEPNKVDSVNFLSDRVIKLNVHDRYSVDDVLTYAHYILKSTDDADYTQAQFPQTIGRHWFVKEFPANSTNPITKNELFLVFDKPLKNNKNYTLTINDVEDLAGNHFNAPQNFNFPFSDEGLINHSIKVNQVGYFTWGPKYGYIGNYLGDAGAMPLFPLGFQIKKQANHETVLSGIPEYNGNDVLRSGEIVYQCNFSSLNTPGSYYLYVPGLGRSFNFEIGERVMDSVYYKSSRALFYQRCGTALDPPYADKRWAHEACHINDGISHQSWLNSPLQNGEAINEYIPAPFGWHDAGDYGKYTISGCSALYYLLTIYELYPEKFADNELNLPESGNGIPDILDEAWHEIKWLMNMQAADGGVYERITTVNWADTMPEDDLAIRYISEKTTPTTAQFAAVMAAAYRLFLPYKPNEANACLQKAKLAFNFLLQHPTLTPQGGYDGKLSGMGGGNYVDSQNDMDERAWAASELYKSTGEDLFHQSFINFWSISPPISGWNQFLDHQFSASMAYATTTKYPTDAAKVNAIKNAVINNASKFIDRLNSNIYRSACGIDVGFGSYGQSSRYSWDLIMAYYLSGDEKYRKYALLSLDVQLGNNPQNTCYITGVGSKSPLHPLHHPSLHDGVDEPVPGIPVFGPDAQLALSNPYNMAVQSEYNLYPNGTTLNSPYPVLRKYFDISSNPEMSEFNIIDEAITASVFGFFKTTPLQSLPQQSANKLNYFIGNYNQDQIALRWEMGSEYGVASYLIEKSQDGINFVPSETISGLGDSNSPRQYLSTDHLPFAIATYYRLKINQSDGGFIYSPIITVKTQGSKQTTFMLFPNPVIDKINIIIPQSDNILYKWNTLITDIHGNIIFETYQDLGTVTEQINQQLPKIPPGIYIIELKNEKITLREKMVRN